MSGEVCKRQFCSISYQSLVFHTYNNREAIACIEHFLNHFESCLAQRTDKMLIEIVTFTCFLEVKTFAADNKFELDYFDIFGVKK